MDQTEQYLAANRKRWDELTLAHRNSEFYDLEGFKAGKDRLRSIELEELGDVSGKTLLHLQCHFGMDTLAWARRGAVVTGVDFSPRSIALAQELSAELSISARFICANVYDLPEILDDEFDIVFTSYGVLHGLPDIAAWGQVVARYVNTGGIFYIVEDHPMFRTFRAKPGDTFQAERRYFHSDTPQQIEVKGSYATGGEGQAGESYIWDFSMSDVINALIGAGLRIEFLHEFPFAARAKFPWMLQGEDGWWRLPPEQHGIIPFLFSLQARKQAD